MQDMFQCTFGYCGKEKKLRMKKLFDQNLIETNNTKMQPQQVFEYVNEQSAVLKCQWIGSSTYNKKNIKVQIKKKNDSHYFLICIPPACTVVAKKIKNPPEACPVCFFFF